MTRMIDYLHGLLTYDLYDKVGPMTRMPHDPYDLY